MHIDLQIEEEMPAQGCSVAGAGGEFTRKFFRCCDTDPSLTADTTGSSSEEQSVEVCAGASRSADAALSAYVEA